MDKQFDRTLFCQVETENLAMFDGHMWEFDLFYNGEMIGKRSKRTYKSPIVPNDDTVKANDGLIYDITKYGAEKLMYWLLEHKHEGERR